MVIYYKMILRMNRKKSVVFAFALSVLAVSCSVKEDRQACPCRLVLHLDAIDTSLVNTLYVRAVSSEALVFLDTLSTIGLSETYVRDVPHDDIVVTVWGSSRGDADLIIPYGKECPSLYMDAFHADTHGEICHKDVRLYKNHCRLTVLLDGRDDLPYSLTFRGHVNGYGMDGLPSEGSFSCVAYPGQGKGMSAAVPRQLDSSLLLDVQDEGTSIIRTFALGEYLEQSGFDWQEKDLKDATIVVDYSVTGIRITYKGWDKEYHYDIIL